MKAVGIKIKIGVLNLNSVQGYVGSSNSIWDN